MKYLLLFFPFILLSQEFLLEVEYERTLTTEYSGSVFTRPSYLLTDKGASLYYIDFTTNENTNGVLLDVEQTDGRVAKVIAQKTNEYLFKDFEEEILISPERILRNKFIVKEGLDELRWKINNEFKEILGFKVQKAKTKFRGRNYTAWFAQEIPIRNGPWKFQNLPGLILEVKADDGIIHFLATSIKTLEQGAREDIENPHKNKDSITRSEFESLFIKKQVDLGNFQPAEGKRFQMNSGIELISTK